jgi:hypothetical protein
MCLDCSHGFGTRFGVPNVSSEAKSIKNPMGLKLKNLATDTSCPWLTASTTTVLNSAMETTRDRATPIPSLFHHHQCNSNQRQRITRVAFSISGQSTLGTQPLYPNLSGVALSALILVGLSLSQA